MPQQAAIKPRSLKVNFVLNNLRLVLNMLMPLVTFPYLTRVLGPASLGKVEFAYSIVSYFVLFAAIGIPTYAMREIARVRDDDYLRNKTVREIALLLLTTITVSYVVYFLLVFLTPTLRADYLLFLIIAPSIFLTDFSFEWFYQGIEDQLFITSRYIVVKILQAVAIFTLIHSPNDYLLYAAIFIGLSSISTVANLLHLRKYQTTPVPLRKLQFRHHLRPSLYIFAAQVATSIYCHLDTTLIGLIRTDEEVGFYTASNRIVRVLISVVTALATVIVPKIENALAHGDTEAYRRFLRLSLSYVFLLGLPLALGLTIVAPEAIILFAGDKYQPAVLATQMLTPILVIVPLANFVGLQVLFANRKEKYYTLAVSIAAAANFVANLLLIPSYGIYGAVVGTLIAEAIGLAVMSVLGRSFLRHAQLHLPYWKYLLASSLMALAVFITRQACAPLDYIPRLLLSTAAGILIYALLILLLKEPTTYSLLHRHKA